MEENQKSITKTSVVMTIMVFGENQCFPKWQYFLSLVQAYNYGQSFTIIFLAKSRNDFF